MKEIRFYRTSSGRIPVEEFLISLPSKARQKAAFVLKVIRETHPIPIEYFKKLRNTDDIWEARIQFAGNIYRLLGFLKKIISSFWSVDLPKNLKKHRKGK